MSEILESIARSKQAQSSQDTTQSTYDGESQFGRTMMGGLTLGFWDEIEAAARSAVNGFSDYEQVRDEIRVKMKQYQEANPGTALTAEVIGAVAPTALLMFTPGGQPADIEKLQRMGTGQ